MTYDAKPVIANQKLKFLKNPQYDYLIVGSVVMLIVLLNLLWRGLETRPPHYDMARHLWTSLGYLAMFKAKSHYFFMGYSYYPPLFYWLTIPFYLVFKPSIMAAVASNSIYIAILAFSTYGIGKELWGRRVGLLSSTLVLTTPMIISQFKEYQIDAPLVAWVTLTLWLLLKSKEFSDKRYSYILGAVFGLGMLLKWTFPFVMAAPLGLAGLLAVVCSVKEKNLYRVKNMALAAVFAYAIAAPWYLANYTQLRIDLVQNSGQAGIQEGDPLVGTFQSNVWYANNLLNSQLYLLPALLLVVGLIYTLRRDALVKNRYPLLLLFGGLAFFTVLQNKDPRYTLPILPAIAVLSSFWVVRLRVAWSNVLAGALVLYSVLIFWLVSFGIPQLPKALSFSLNRNYGVTLFRQSGYIIGPPTRERWYQEEAFRYLKDHGAKSVFSIGTDSIWLNGWGYHYYSVLYGIPLADSAKGAEYLLVRTNQRDPAALTSYNLPDSTILSVVRADLEPSQ